MPRTLPALILLLPLVAACVAVDGEGRRPSRIDWALANQGMPPDLASPAHHAALDARARASLEESQGRWGESLDAWTQVLADTPDDVDAALGAARAYHALERLGDAQAVLERAAQHHPQDARLARALGLTQLARGSVDDALSWLRQAADAEPDDAGRTSDLLATLMLTGHTDEAVSRAVAFAPRAFPPALRLTLGRAAMLRDHADWAAPALASALDDDPSDIDAWIDLGRAQVLLGAWPAARSALQRALVLDGGRPDALTLLGHAWLQDGRPDEALRSYQAAVDAGASATSLAPLVARARARLGAAEPPP